MTVPDASPVTGDPDIAAGHRLTVQQAHDISRVAPWGPDMSADSRVLLVRGVDKGAPWALSGLPSAVIDAIRAEIQRVAPRP